MIAKHLLAALWQQIKRRLNHHASDESNDLAILKERDAKPSHCLLRIESFNELSENLTSRAIVNYFNAGGYLWKLFIFPKGDEENDGKDHISIYLDVADKADLPVGWEINATFNFFIYDQIRNKYVGLKDARKRCFHSLKGQWGVVKFIDLKTFNNPKNGYLVNDTCVFGVEVFISCVEECLSVIREPERICRYKWEVHSFSKKIHDKWYKSDFFIGGDYEWRLLLIMNPNCDALNKGNITVGLQLENSSLPPNNLLVFNFIIRLVNQYKQDEDIEFSGTSGFHSSRYTEPSKYGDCIFEQEIDFLKGTNFISLAELQDPKMGYLVNDTCIIEVEIDILALQSPLIDCL